MDTMIFPAVCALVDQRVGKVMSAEDGAQLAARFMDLVMAPPLDLRTLQPQQCGSYTMQAERLLDTLDEIVALHQAHWRETEQYRHGIPFAFDYARAVHEEACGEYLLLTARHTATGRLVGNYALVLARSRHTQTGVAMPAPVASEDTLFILDGHRKGRLPYRMVQFAEDAARHYGARELRVSTKLTNHVGQMLERMGYAHTANQYAKVF